MSDQWADECTVAPAAARLWGAVAALEHSTGGAFGYPFSPVAPQQAVPGCCGHVGQSGCFPSFGLRVAALDL